MRNDFGVDQADGLRRLLVTRQTRVITLVAGKSGVGCTSTAINLAAVLARSGKDVLVLDENNSPENVLDRLGLHARHDLLDVIQGSRKLREAVVNAEGFSVLSTARAMHTLATSIPHEGNGPRSAKLNQTGQQRLESSLADLGNGMDVILVDAALPAPSQFSGHAPVQGMRDDSQVSSYLARGNSFMVVVDATASGITEGYALIKRLTLENTRLQFGIVVNKVAGEKAARTVFENMAKLARRNLAARLEYLGCIPRDDKLKRAAQLGKSVVEAFPAAVSAQSYMGLALKLLLMPMRQDDAQGAVNNAMRDLMQQASQPQRRFSREIAPVVN